MSERKFGVIITTDGSVPTMREAIEADVEMGNHHLTNISSEEFARKYPTILAVAIANDQLREEYERKLGIES